MLKNSRREICWCPCGTPEKDWDKVGRKVATLDSVTYIYRKGGNPRKKEFANSESMKF